MKNGQKKIQDKILNNKNLCIYILYVRNTKTVCLNLFFIYISEVIEKLKEYIIKIKLKILVLYCECITKRLIKCRNKYLQGFF